MSGSEILILIISLVLCGFFWFNGFSRCFPFGRNPELNLRVERFF